MKTNKQKKNIDPRFFNLQAGYQIMVSQKCVSV